jgi:hypothetical protein
MGLLYDHSVMALVAFGVVFQVAAAGRSSDCESRSRSWPPRRNETLRMLRMPDRHMMAPMR